MKIFIQVKANKQEERVEKIDAKNYQVLVKAPAKEGKANQAVVKILAAYFKIPKSNVVIVLGLKSRKKIVKLII